jgi:hypothetical protein
MTRKRQFIPKGIPLSVLAQVEKMGDMAWAGGIRLVLCEQRNRYVTADQVSTALKRLANNGLVEFIGAEKYSPNGGRRKYYRITEVGRVVLEQEMRLYDGFTRKPDMYDKADAA